jgi:hypothetical protein
MNLLRKTLIGLAVVPAFMTTQASFAQEIETLVMPGDVISAHIDIESECSSCHKLFDKSSQRVLCLDCHEDVAADVNQEVGFHGRHAEASSAQCSSCHTEHEGRNAVLIILDEEDFDHAFTDFELLGAHQDAECSDCHERSKKHREADDQCVDCHKEDEPHQDRMGTDCGNCHQPTEWLAAEFDHDTTDYALLGKHGDAACLGCHEDRTFPSPPTACIDCHAEDDAHDGRSGNDCANCHNPSDWHDSSFDHSRDTDFELLGKHAELSCGDCHSESPFDDVMDIACVSCHLDDDEHDGHNAEQCDTCHSNSTWPETKFNHDTDTEYGLRGAHKEIACNDCHVEPIFEVELVSTCESCHAEEDPHEGSLGVLCENCHTEVTWQDPVFFDHDLTSFPLLGVHDEKECEDCHKTKVFTVVDDSCTACHEDDDPHRDNFTGRCGACHNPVAWDLWVFDHNVQTEFELSGAHIKVACNDCHRSTLRKMKAVNSSCGNCHRADDIHDNEFGFDCGRCHSADSFSEVRSLQ